MRSFTTLFLTLSLILVTSCASTLRQNEIDPWLNARSSGQPPQINITGRWHDAQETGSRGWGYWGWGSLGWGEGYLQQEGNKVTGAIGNYNVQGIVSGKTVYLVFLYGGSVHYTARLEMSQQGLLAGNYFKGNDRGQTTGYPALFARTGDAPR